jgi:basic membrane protein A and related proteins
VEQDLGAQITFIEATDPATYEQTLRNLGNAETDIIVATFPGMQEPLAAVAGDFPDTKFIHIFGDPDETPIDNVLRISYEIHPGFYLGGMLAAAMSESGQIGYIGGVALPSLAANFHAYRAGAESVNPDIAVEGAWADSFEDPAVGLEIASSMYSGGVDVIQTDAAATSNGVLEAAQDAGTFMIKDSDPTQFELAPDTIVAVSFLRFGQSLYDQVTAALEPEWAGGATTSGINEDITGLALNDQFAEVGAPEAVERFEAILPEIDAARDAIVSGELEVPFITDTSFD